MNLELLKQIVANDAASKPSYVSADAKPLADAGLIEVNLEVKNDKGEVMARSTDAGKAKAAEPAEAGKSTGNYQIMSGITLPPAKRRGNMSGSGAPAKYPFAELPVGGVFFSGNSEHKKGDAVKALGSTVSAQNDKYSEPTGEMRTITRAVRDKVSKKAVLNADGSKQMETVELPVKKYNRKFAIRPVDAGYQSGGWTAPEAGALISRTV